mmetsp:Transcript_38015/g.70138  ORF Transcript_38015/g.70138 Transcript_38015/m.70138 type:complete len:89 (-) Transcript_38015:177-443(-)
MSSRGNAVPGERAEPMAAVTEEKARLGLCGGRIVPSPTDSAPYQLGFLKRLQISVLSGAGLREESVNRIVVPCWCSTAEQSSYIDQYL